MALNIKAKKGDLIRFESQNEYIVTSNDEQVSGLCGIVIHSATKTNPVGFKASDLAPTYEILGTVKDFTEFEKLIYNINEEEI